MAVPSDHGITGTGGDTTVVVPVAAHLDVAIHAPGLTPAATKHKE